MRRETQNILLILLGGALIKIALDGSYLRYVKPFQQPWLILAGAVMVGLAAAAIAKDIIAKRASGDGHADGGHTHRTRSTWMLVLPVLAIFLIAPPALGADTVNRSGSRSIAQAQSVAKTQFPPLPAGDPLPMAMKDVITRAGWDATNALTGRTIRITGFIARKGDATYLARLIINCCAADAFPVKVKLTGGGTAGLRNDQWIDATGAVLPDTATAANSYTPTFVLSSVNPIPTPNDPYEY